MAEKLGSALLELATDDSKFTSGVDRAEGRATALGKTLDMTSGSALELADKLVSDNQARVEVGTLAPLDIVQAQSEAATRRQNLAAAEATGTALEINGSLPRLDMSVEALRRARERDVTFVLTSDAHRASELDRVQYAVLNAERAWVPAERVANTWPAERLAAWAERG